MDSNFTDPRLNKVVKKREKLTSILTTEYLKIRNITKITLPGVLKDLFFN